MADRDGSQLGVRRLPKQLRGSLTQFLEDSAAGLSLPFRLILEKTEKRLPPTQMLYSNGQRHFSYKVLERTVTMIFEGMELPFLPY